jgi:hypothetical protein
MAEERLFEHIGSLDDFKKYVKLLLNQYQIVDGYWFSYIEKQYGLEPAVRMNEEIWGKIGAKTAKDIKSLFNLQGKGVDRVFYALKYLPWYTITDYHAQMKGEELTIDIPHCLPQEIRAKKKMGEYPCREMHFRILDNFVREIDDSIQVSCEFAPPGPHPKDLWCRWIIKPGNGHMKD